MKAAPHEEVAAHEYERVPGEEAETPREPIFSRARVVHQPHDVVPPDLDALVQQGLPDLATVIVFMNPGS